MSEVCAGVLLCPPCVGVSLCPPCVGVLLCPPCVGVSGVRTGGFYDSSLLNDGSFCLYIRYIFSLV